MKKICNWATLLFVCLTTMTFVACEEENITTETYSFPDVYVALIRVTPPEAVAGSDILIEGNDLDHVKTVRFGNDTIGSVVDVDKSNFKSQTKVSIVVTVPDNAPAGDISVITDDNKTIKWLREMADKNPFILDVTPDMVAVGDTITLFGGNFDYVKAVLFSNGEGISKAVPKDDFESISVEDSTIVVVIPEGAPVEKVALITNYDQVVFWNGTLSGRVLSVIDFTPKGTVVVGTDITVTVTNIDLVRSVSFGTNTANYTVDEEESLITVTIPNNIPEGKYALNINTWNGDVKVADFDIVRLYLDPVWDISHVYFDFDGKGSWWGDCPQTVENEPDYSISGSYFHIKATASADWYGLFWRNSGNDLNISGVNVNNWVVKYDINVLGDAITSIKIRLGNFWYVTGVNPNIGGWYTITASLSGFRDNNGEGNPMTDADIAALVTSGDFGLADGGAGGEYDVLIDNVRFESKTPFTYPVANPAYVYFDFDGKGSWWGDCPQTVENDPSYSISGSYFHIEATAAAGWYGLFWRNSGNDLNVSGVTVNDWVVRYDINVLGEPITSFKIRLGDFWYVTGVNPNLGGWYTYTAPLSGFRDNNGEGNPMTDADVAAMATGGDFGFADGGPGGEYNVLIDNVRFEPK